jgi:phosphinothricin acetyltransferase
MSAIQTRSAVAADLAAITAIYTDAVETGTATFELEPPDLADMSRRFELLMSDHFPYLVATLDKAVVGYAYAGPYRPRQAYRFTVEDSIYLAPSAQRQGVGTMLLRQLIVQCEARGFRQMVAVIGGSENVASVRLHERAGFKMIGTMDNVGFKFGRWVDTVLMQRALGPGGENLP